MTHHIKQIKVNIELEKLVFDKSVELKIPVADLWNYFAAEGLLNLESSDKSLLALCYELKGNSRRKFRRKINIDILLIHLSLKQSSSGQ